MKRYLSQIPLSQAIGMMEEHFSRPDRRETIPVSRAAGRVSAAAVSAPDTIPACRIALVDGVAVHSADTRGARDRTPCEPEDLIWVNTGQTVPDGYDAIIASEELGKSASGKTEIRKPARPNQNIRNPGDEVRKGRLIFPAGHRITASDIGALLTCGITSIVVRSFSVTLIPTGDELVGQTEMPGPGEVRESNTAMIAAMLIPGGIAVVLSPPVPDDRDQLRQMLRVALDTSDIILVSAGSSAGTRDHTREVIGEMGTILFHGVAIRPGKSILCGDIDGKPVIGLPGQPVASLTAFREVVMPVLSSWGCWFPPPVRCTARIAEPIPSDGGIDEFIPVSVFRLEGDRIILPRPRGPGGQMHLVRSNAILHVPAKKEGYPKGAEVPVTLIRGLIDEDRILLAGLSGELTDALETACGDAGIPISIRPVSETGAVAAICSGTCHAIILSGDIMNQQSGAMELLRTSSPDPLAVILLGTVQTGICSPDPADAATVSAMPGIACPDGTDPAVFSRGEEGIVLSPDQLIPCGTADRVVSAVLSGEAAGGICSPEAARQAGLSFLPVRAEPGYLIYRETGRTGDELGPLIRFLGSAAWQEREPASARVRPGEKVSRIPAGRPDSGSERLITDMAEP